MPPETETEPVTEPEVDPAAPPANPLVDDTDPMTDLANGHIDKWDDTGDMLERWYNETVVDPPAADPAEDPESPAPDVPASVEEPDATGDVPPVVPGGAPEPIVPAAFTLPDGTAIPADEASQQLAWLRSLTPAQVQAVQAALNPAPQPQVYSPAASGPGVPAPVVPVGGTPAGAGYAPPLAQPAPVVDWSVLDAAVPGAGTVIASLQQQTQAQAQQLAAYQQQQAELAAQQAQSQQSQTQAQVDAAWDTYRAAHTDLASTDLDYIYQRGVQMQTFPALVRQHNGNIEAALHATLDGAMWSDPRFRDRALQSSMTQTAQVQAGIDAKKNRMAALNGTTGTVPRSGRPTNPATLTPQQRTAAIAAELAADQANPV